MNRIQRWTLIGGLLLVVLATLFPPVTKVIVYRGDNRYEAAGRCFLVAPDRWTVMRSWTVGSDSSLTIDDRTYHRIDYYRLGLEWVVIVALTGAVFLIARTRGMRGTDAGEPDSQQPS